MVKVTHERVLDQDAYDLFMHDEGRGYYDDNGTWVSNRVPCATIPGPVFHALTGVSEADCPSFGHCKERDMAGCAYCGTD